MNTDLIEKRKNDFEKDFFKLMNNVVFGKPMERKKEKKDTAERKKTVSCQN